MTGQADSAAHRLEDATASEPVERLLRRLRKVRRVGSDQWEALCPAHEDRTPSLRVSVGEDGCALAHCCAGCETSAVVASVGLSLADLFLHHAQQEEARTLRASKNLQSKQSKQEPLELPRSAREDWPPLSEWTEHAYLANELERRSGQSRTWGFTFRVKAHPAVVGADEEMAAATIPWELTDFDDEDQIRIMDEWGRVRNATGRDALAWAVLAAMDAPLRLEIGGLGGNLILRRLVTIADRLQELAASATILLPCAKLGAALEVHPATITRTRRIMERRGWLELVRAHNRRAGRAAEYRFYAERVPFVPDQGVEL